MLTYSLSSIGGLPVLRIPMPSVSSVTTLVLANTGSRYERPEKEGIAHFFEHIVFKGTEHYPSALELSSAIDSIGAEFNAFTSKEYTGYYVKSASKHLKTSLDVISDMLLQPLLKPEDIEREKGVIIEEINMYKDNPMSQVANLFDQLFFSGHGLKHDIVGTKETVGSITQQDFDEFLAQWYGLGNLILIIAGDAEIVTSAETQKLVEEAFAKHPRGERQSAKQATKPFYSSNPIASDRIALFTKQTEQAHLILGWPGFPRSTDKRPILSVLSTILGGNMSSRLFTEVREKRGLCYYVHGDVDFYHDAGIVGAAAGVDPQRVYEAIKVIVAECRALGSGEKPITAQELIKAKDYIAGTLVLSLEDSKDVAQYYGSKQLILNEVETPEEVLKKIQAVTAQEVEALAKEIFVNEEPKLAVVGPFSEKEKFEEALKG